jgi:hypothetical protein
MRQFDLFEPPQLERPASISAGFVFPFAGRHLRVVKAYGSDAAAPVIVEELASFGASTLKGQYALWSLQGVQRAAATAYTITTALAGARRGKR